MPDNRFDYSLNDSQASDIMPTTPNEFDFGAYMDYEAEKADHCRAFWKADSGILVYRRMRAADAFSYGCRDMKNSLYLQLGALKASMQYTADIPNFLEPWYGIGVAASAFGGRYSWEQGFAPAVQPLFDSCEEAMSISTIPISQTDMGKHILRMIDFFLEETRGVLPISLTDVQSPLNAACGIVDINRFFMEMVDEPDQTQAFLYRLAELISSFAMEQKKAIGTALVLPGHGFASCRAFAGLGMSDDNSTMLSPDLHARIVKPALEKCGEAFGGPAYHSCGDWSSLLKVIRDVRGLKMVDGAFSHETDPHPNEAEKFRNAFRASSIVVNMRVVGSARTVAEQVGKIWTPGMKLIAVTYCKTPEEQAEAYRAIHEICR
jgi:hypothetical protein